MSKNWSTGNKIVSSKDTNCLQLSVRVYNALEGQEGYSLTVINGRVSDLEAAVVVPVMVVVHQYMTEMLDIMTAATSQSSNYVKVLTEAYQERQKLGTIPRK